MDWINREGAKGAKKSKLVVLNLFALFAHLR